MCVTRDPCPSTATKLFPPSGLIVRQRDPGGCRHGEGPWGQLYVGSGKWEVLLQGVMDDVMSKLTSRRRRAGQGQTCLACV